MAKERSKNYEHSVIMFVSVLFHRKIRGPIHCITMRKTEHFVKMYLKG